MNSYSHELTIAEEQVSEEALSALDAHFSVDGFYSEDGHWHVFFRDEPQLTKVSEVLGLSQKELKLTTLAPRNWNALWESNFKEVVIDDFCRIHADFHHKEAAAYDYEILINPKMSFGTGHHATTFMMIESMRGLDLKGKDVLDFGTGTGVLAILAKKMGAAAVVANDISIHAFENSEENLKRNAVEEIELFHGGLELLPQGQKYDLILANVNRSVLLRDADALIGLMKPGGVLLLSGILAVDENLLRQHYEDRGVRLKNRKEKNDWICIAFQ